MDSNNVLNLVIVGTVLVLLIIIQQNYGYGGENFVGRVPQTPIGNGGMFYGVPGNQGVYGQPMMFPEQLYQSKIPYYNDTVNNMGRPCKGQEGCGTFGACQNGVCTTRDQTGTVMNLKI